MYIIHHTYRTNGEKDINENKYNWIANLVALYTRNADSIDDLDSNSMSFVTFNYDSIIEDAFLFFLKSSEIFSESSLHHVPQVHHVHGKLEFPENPSMSDVWDMSQGISFIRETETRFDKKNEIRSIISSAKTIYMVGFDCDERNSNLIDISNSNANKYAINYDCNRGLERRLLSIGVGDRDILSGSASNPMTIARACGEGFFDQA